jgi:hypothetical protein
VGRRPLEEGEANPRLSWYGDSVGRYEGDELVIDTIGFNDKTFLDQTYNVPHTTQLHVVGRFKLINDGKGLEVNFIVDDPGAFNAPWAGGSPPARPRRLAKWRQHVEPEFHRECHWNRFGFRGHHEWSCSR